MGRNSTGDAVGTGCAIVFGAIFLTFWSSLTGTFDVIIARGIIGQLRAEGYPTVSGVITKSALEATQDDDGTTYDAEIEYRYEVAGTTYVADGYRADRWSTSDRDAKQAIVDQYPVDATATVYYDPDDPQTSVLEPGLSGGDLFLLLFMTPFNIVAVGGWALIGWLILGKLRPPKYGGVKIARVPRGWRARLPGPPPLGAAAVAALVVSFVSIIPVALIFGDPPMSVALAVWGLVLAAAVGAFAWCWIMARSGRYDLIVEHAGGTLELPNIAHDETGGRGFATSIPRLHRDQVRDVTVRRDRKKKDKDADSYHHVIVVQWIDELDRERSTRFGSFSNGRNARAFLAWIRERLGFEVEASVP